MSKQRNTSKAGLIAMLAIGLVGAGALAVYVKSGADKVSHEHPSTDEPTVIPENQSKPKDQKQLAHQSTVVLAPVMNGLDLSFTRETKDVPDGADPKVFALSEYLQKIPALPKGAKVIGVEVKDRTAIVSVTKEFEEGGYGAEDEKAVLDGIAATLGTDLSVDLVQFEVGGIRVESLGHADLTEPMPVIRPDGTRPEARSNPKP